MPEHEHEFATVVAGYTKPGEASVQWEACRSCGEENPGHPRPEEAQDRPPPKESDEGIKEPMGASDSVTAKLGKKTSKGAS